MGITKEQKLKVLDKAISILKNGYINGMCFALYMAKAEILEIYSQKHKKLFPKYTRFNYFLKNTRWSVIKEFIKYSGYWDTSDYDDKEGTLKAQERRIKFLEYLKTTI